MAVSPPPAPSSIDLSGLPPRVVEAAARVLALCREELRSEPRPEAPEAVELRVREATNEFARDVMGAVIENRDDGRFPDRAGRAELVPGLRLELLLFSRPLDSMHISHRSRASVAEGRSLFQQHSVVR